MSELVPNVPLTQAVSSRARTRKLLMVVKSGVEMI